MKKAMKPVVALAMSGGVDSSLSAALLLEQGFQVLGFFAKTWSPSPGDGTDCTWVADRRDALRVAAQLNIPLVTLDLEADYRAGVIDPLFAGYANGETPNPDVLCNRVIKFGALWQAARRLGAEFVATGHYAQIRHGVDGPVITRGVDAQKDQTYFLWNIPRSIIPHVLFPIGHLPKETVRAEAARRNIAVATKRDSQGICFLGQTDVQSFLTTRLSDRPGLVRETVSQAIVGDHQGTFLFTLGQRHGLGNLRRTSQSPEQRYVVDIDPTTDTVWIGERAELLHTKLAVRSLNWLVSDEEIESILRSSNLMAQVRYRQDACPVVIDDYAGDRMICRFVEPIWAPTPGQSWVLYDGNRLVGGGIIDRIADPVQPAPTLQRRQQTMVK